MFGWSFHGNRKEPEFLDYLYWQGANDMAGYECLAPTLSFLQKWFREKHNIIVTSLPYEDEIPECEGEKRQTLWEDETIDCREIPWLREITTYTYYHSYEEALKQGLRKALNMLP